MHILIKSASFATHAELRVQNKNVHTLILKLIFQS